MKNNFYFQHQVMARHDARMSRLFDEEGPRGIGTYWILVEQLSMFPDSKAAIEKVIFYCKSQKLTASYMRKIIFGYDLFIIEEDEYISPMELNPSKRSTKKASKNSVTNSFSDAKNTKNRQKPIEKSQNATYRKNSNSLSINELAKNNSGNKENIRDIKTTTTTEKEKEKPAAVVVDEKILEEKKPVVVDDEKKMQKEKPVVYRGTLRKNTFETFRVKITNEPIAEMPSQELSPTIAWQNHVDELAQRSAWLEVVCMHSGFGELLMRRIGDALESFKRHIELYDKSREIVSVSDAKRYFANYSGMGSRTSKSLHGELKALDEKQKSTEPLDPYRYEQIINNQRTYLGCVIPDDAPPRPDDTAFWNEITQSWDTQSNQYLPTDNGNTTKY